MMTSTCTTQASDNSSAIAAEAIGTEGTNHVTIAMLLEEAQGGRCDACRTTVEGAPPPLPPVGFPSER